MIGHEKLLAMRRSGLRPRTVFIDAYDFPVDDFWAKAWHAEIPYVAQLAIGPDELISGLDLRCVSALPVLISGTSQKRVRSVADLCVEAGAKSIVIAFGDDEHMTVEDIHVAQDPDA